MYTASVTVKTEIDPSSDNMWQAVVAGDITADFFYAVQSTGIYCRPGCSSRLPKRENVQFFSSWEQAEKAGFRACKRCSPKDPDATNINASIIARACMQIETATTPPRLEDLALDANLSTSHFHQLFKEIVGITPRQYYDQVRLSRVQSMLEQNKPVVEAIYDAGYQSSSRFYEDVSSKIGMTPGEYQNKGQYQKIYYAAVACYLGWVLVAATNRGICAIDLGDDPGSLIATLQARFPNASLIADNPGYFAWINQVVNYLEFPEQALDLPLDIQGTAFQRKVWNALREIPAGQTRFYSEIAEQIGAPRSARAVANACAANNLAAVIPCHRVVPKNGGLGGYRWGTSRKKALLEHENSG